MSRTHLQLEDVARSQRCMRVCLFSGIVGTSFALASILMVAAGQSKKRQPHVTTEPAPSALPHDESFVPLLDMSCDPNEEPLGAGGPLLPAEPETSNGFADPAINEEARRYREFVSAMQANATTSPTAKAKSPFLKHYPVDHPRISSPFGHRRDPLSRGRAFHGGIDFAGRTGEPVRAVAAGVVIQAGYQRDYGHVVRIDHGKGRVTLYAHNQRVIVKTGERVKSGQQIARLGSTGRSTGPHLHFEMRVHGRRVDPKPHLLRVSPTRG